MRATFAGFNTALSTLQANQKRLDITGQNLANMNTVGYTRQQLNTSGLNYSNGYSLNMNGASNIVGFGVSMNGVSQIRDPYLDVQYRLQMTKADYTNSLQTSLDSLGDILDETSISGIHQAFVDIQSALNDMQDSSKVNDPVFESQLRTRMQTLVSLFNKSASQLTEAEKAEFDRLTGKGTSEQGAVEKVNEILRQIGDLNTQIKQNQIAGQPSLELMDQRNVLLDELSSYVPIEITYYKDDAHSGTYEYTYPDGTKQTRDRAYDYDANGNIIGKREWPDDLRVEMTYKDANGNSQKLTLIEGSERGKNYGQLEAVKADDNAVSADRNDPSNIAIKFTGAGANAGSVVSHAGGAQFSGGSIQAGLDMLGKKGTGTPATDNVRGYQFYREKLDTLAKTFADEMNKLNNTPGSSGGGDLFTGNGGNIDASNISINTDWVSGKVHIAKGPNNENDTILGMMKLMEQTNVNGMEGKTFADFMNHVSTQLASDSSANQTALKNNVTVLNSIQYSRDSVSGVSLDEEAANMMTYVSAYNAASRLMTTLDEVLNSLLSIGA